MTESNGTPENGHGATPAPNHESALGNTADGPQYPTEQLGSYSAPTAPVQHTPTAPVASWQSPSWQNAAPQNTGEPRYGVHSAEQSAQHAQQPTQAQQQPTYGQYAGSSFGTPTPPPPSIPPGQYPASNGGPRAPKRKVGAGIFVASVVAAALIGGGAAAGTTLLVGNIGSSSSSVAPAQNSPLIVNNTDSVNAVTAAAQKASPSVVTISATSGQSGGTGSGVILDTAGHILTNTHVVTLDGQAANAAIEVRTSDGKVYTAKVVGTDPLNDLAVIKIDAPNLTPATLGDSSKINVGDTVVAIGAPLGLAGTVTDGIVSTLNRTISVASSAVPKSQSDSSQGSNGGGNGFNFAPPDGSNGTKSSGAGSISLNVIQTDAAINPGNSGGALTNTKGEVIGINVAIASASQSSSTSSGQSGNIGVGFSIPINNAKRIADEIISTGSATHGQLGVSVKPAAASTNSQFDVGAQIASVTSGSAADKAGLKVGDVVTHLGDRTITDASELTAAVREQAAGATVKVTFLRDGKQQAVDVKLDAASVGG